MPGAISTHSDAWNGTGRNPRAVLPMKVACCGWSASRKQYVRRTVPIARGHASTRGFCRSTRRAAIAVACVARVRRDRARAMMAHDSMRARLAWVLFGLRAGVSPHADSDLLGRVLKPAEDHPVVARPPRQSPVSPG